MNRVREGKKGLAIGLVVGCLVALVVMVAGSLGECGHLICTQCLSCSNEKRTFAYGEFWDWDSLFNLFFYFSLTSGIVGFFYGAFGKKQADIGANVQKENRKSIMPMAGGWLLLMVVLYFVVLGLRYFVMN